MLKLNSHHHHHHHGHHGQPEVIAVLDDFDREYVLHALEHLPYAELCLMHVLTTAIVFALKSLLLLTAWHAPSLSSVCSYHFAEDAKDCGFFHALVRTNTSVLREIWA